MLALALLLSAEVSFTGSVSTREEATAPSETSLLSTADLPILESLNEINVRGKAVLLDEKLRFGADASAFVPFGGVFADADADTRAMKTIDDHAVASLQPFVALSEYWASAEPVEHVQLTLGKKRLTWGPGLAASPTDLLNPARDPTDPSLQRAGFLHARADFPFERFTVTALFAPAVLDTVDGIPTAVLRRPDAALVFPRIVSAGPQPVADTSYHYAAVLRAYALVADADVNTWLVWTNKYGDDFENKPRAAFTISRNLFGAHEVHAEVLVQQGSPRLYADHACVANARALAACVGGAAPSGAPLAASKLDSGRYFPRILVGWRYMPDDGSMLSLEYLYQSDGYLRTEYDDFTRLFALAGEAQRRGAAAGLTPTSSGSGGGEVPNRFAFEPRRRHYLFLSYTKPQVLDDFTLGATLITPVEDLSALASGSVAWQAQEWLSISLFGFAPLPSPAFASAGIHADPLQHLYDAVDPAWRGFVPRGAPILGVPVGEYDALPFKAQVMLEARAFF